MSKYQKASLTLLRVVLGIYYLNAGLPKVLNSEWTAEGFLNSATNFSGFFSWFASDGNIAWINFLNEWSLVLLGVALILGLFVRWAAIGGIILMFLYYLANIGWPFVDSHAIDIAALLVLIQFNAGNYLGLDGIFRKKK